VSIVCILFLWLGSSDSLMAAQTDIAGPAGSGLFGLYVTVLPNGNFVVTDPYFDLPGPVTDVGAAYLYDGATLALISSIRGSTANDRVGDGGVVVLANGNFVVRSAYWNNGAASQAGAVTWGSALNGFISSVVSPGNSLVGASAGDRVGGDNTFAGLTVLTNGNYVVSSPFWDDPGSLATDVGAATLCFGSGTVGVVQSSNSLVGSSTDDHVGLSVTRLTNGNYVVGSKEWDLASLSAGDAGAVTWRDGNTSNGTLGAVVDQSNSLIGRSGGDLVGAGVFPLTNGNYVVSSPTWDNWNMPMVTDAGAVTWGSGSGPTTGVVSQNNSLIGVTAGDNVGGGSGSGVVPLTNGTYVVASPLWDNPISATADVGAVTWCTGTAPTVTTVSLGNSLVGTTANDRVAGSNFGPHTGVVALTNGNYVVASPYWNSVAPATADVGAVTWCNGGTGRIGTVSPSNSLIGTTTGDSVGFGTLFGSKAITPLINGNYVVASSSWNSPSVQFAGAITWGNGASGTTGTVSSTNSLVGGFIGDLNEALVTPLANGNYVVSMNTWDSVSPSISNAGAVTLCNASGGTVGVVTSSNSLVGGTSNDFVGNRVTALTDGNYVVRSYFWDSPSPAVVNAGAVTWCNGNSGRTGLITATNSLVGGTAEDYVGSNDVTALPYGQFVINSSGWNNPIGPAPIVGAITLSSGGVTGPITRANSVLGTFPSQFGALLTYSYDSKRRRLFVGRAANCIVSIRSFRTYFDFDGDGKDDVSVFRPSTGYWYLSQSTNGFLAVPFGTNGDQIAPGDYDGDRITDIAVFRPSAGYWYIQNSKDGSFRAFQFGQSGDIPTPGDYDGDGRTDIAVFRPSAGTFYVNYSSDDSFHYQQWGISDDRPIMGDYDGDNKTDFAVFRPSIGTFYIRFSSNGQLGGLQFGQNGDKPIAGDFDGDGKTDIAVFRPGNGGWFYFRSSDGGFRGIGWGASTDIPSAADYDGDGMWDVAVYRPSTNAFYIYQSSTNTLRGEYFGIANDVPVESAYTP
jgi:hypothetical protein